MITPARLFAVLAIVPFLLDSAALARSDDAPHSLQLAQASGGAAGGSGGMTEEQFRQMLQQRSTGFGGIFAPMLQGGGGGGGSVAPAGRTASPQAQREQQCASRYSDYAARQACKNGDLWAADRLQNKRSTGSERDWYNR